MPTTVKRTVIQEENFDEIVDRDDARMEVFISQVHVPLQYLLTHIRVTHQSGHVPGNRRYVMRT